MASTISLQNTINWALPFLNYAPVTIGAANEPALTSANTIMQTVLMAPFNWRWNRATTTIPVVAGQQDYQIPLSEYGHFELGSVQAAGDQAFPLEYKDILGVVQERSRPTFVSDILDDDNGNLTFRFAPVPDQSYSVVITYQKQPPLFTSLGQNWSPIPNWMEYVYNWGFLAVMSDFVDQSKATRFRQLFVGTLLSVSEGLSESEKDVFMAQWLGTERQKQSEQYDTESGWKGRTI